MTISLKASADGLSSIIAVNGVDRFTTAGGTDVFDAGKLNIFWEF